MTSGFVSGGINHTIHRMKWNMTFTTGFFFVLIVISTPIVADTNSNPGWSASCQHKQKHFDIRFQSVSGDITEDDMQVQLRSSRGNTVKLALPPALYTPHGATTALTNLCDQNAAPEQETVVAFPVNDSVVLFWLSKDNRPSFENLLLALVDIDTGQLLDYVDTNMAIKDYNNGQSLVIRQNPLGYEVRLVGEWLQDSKSDTAYSAIEYWMPVIVKNKKIVFTPIRDNRCKN